MLHEYSLPGSFNPKNCSLTQPPDTPKNFSDNLPAQQSLLRDIKLEQIFGADTCLWLLQIKLVFSFLCSLLYCYAKSWLYYIGFCLSSPDFSCYDLYDSTINSPNPYLSALQHRQPLLGLSTLPSTNPQKITLCEPTPSNFFFNDYITFKQASHTLFFFSDIIDIYTKHGSSYRVQDPQPLISNHDNSYKYSNNARELLTSFNRANRFSFKTEPFVEVRPTKQDFSLDIIQVKRQIKQAIQM
ncbi:hypothetical protein BB561_004721 [Smittium simulii]|uniref:Uncharacterized protein n=1 Tax=Smittium simulii TaxID=133385 RepID=A0A2T9YEK0_9FUNG|nr:hypothetical protein BB561_004721 [Smittium simulii]